MTCQLPEESDFDEDARDGAKERSDILGFKHVFLHPDHVSIDMKDHLHLSLFRKSMSKIDTVLHVTANDDDSQAAEVQCSIGAIPQYLCPSHDER